MENADWMLSAHPATYAKIRNLAWVKDSLTQEEARTAQDLFYMGANDHDTLQGILDLHWIQDDVSAPEAKAVKSLMYLSYREADLARKITASQFFDSISEEDALLISGLHGMSHRGTLKPLINHPTVRDGITDDEVIRTVAATTIDHQDQLSRILYPENSTVETIQTASPRTPNLKISIIRAGKQRDAGTSQTVEEAVRFVENFMDLPLPTNHVIVLLDDTAVTAGYAGVNYGDAIAYLTNGEQGSQWERLAFKAGMVHEVAHYFWRGAENWIDEGVANTIERQYAVAVGLPSELTSTRKLTCTTNTLDQLTKLAPGNQSAQYHCNYYLGEKLFLDILNAMGEVPFKTALRDFYTTVLRLHEQDEKAGIAQVRQAFSSQEPLIQKHWDGTPVKAIVAARSPTPTPVLTVSNLQLPTPTEVRISQTHTSLSPTQTITFETLPKMPPNKASTETNTFQPPQSWITLEVPQQGIRLSHPATWEVQIGHNRTYFNGDAPGAWMEIRVTPLGSTQSPDSFLWEYTNETRPRELSTALEASSTRHYVTLPDGTPVIEDRLEVLRHQGACIEKRVTHIRRAEESQEDRRVYVATFSHCETTPAFEEKGRMVLNSIEMIAFRPEAGLWPTQATQTPQPQLTPTLTQALTPIPIAGAQPTPTPQPTTPPELKQVLFTVNPQQQEWEWGGRGQQYVGTNCWTEDTWTSPDLSGLQHQIADTNGQIWTVKSIHIVQRVRKCKGNDSADYWIYLTNDNRADAQFNGYKLAIITPSRNIYGAGNWDPIEDRLPTGQAAITGTTNGAPTGEITFKIWDTFEPNLPSLQSPTPTPVPTQTPVPSPTPRPTPAPTRQASLTLEDDKYAISYGHVWQVADIYSADSNPFFNVRTPHSGESYLGDFYLQYFSEHLDRIRKDFYESGRTYPIYEPIDSAGKGYHIRREYRWQANETQCPYRVVEHYLRSQYPDADYGFIITTGVCEDDPNRQDYEIERELMLKSFREN